MLRGADPGQPPYAVVNYPPVYHLLTVPLAWLLGVLGLPEGGGDGATALQAGRLVSLASTLAAVVALWLLRGYKTWVSPMLPPSCRYQPTCSEYAYEAVEKYGIIKGGRLALWRVLRCNPFGSSGWDPVP